MPTINKATYSSSVQIQFVRAAEKESQRIYYTL